AGQVERSPANFLAAASESAACGPQTSLAGLLAEAVQRKIFPRVVVWTLLDQRRVTLVPPGHWLLIQDSASFRASLQMEKADGGSRNENGCAIHVQSVAVADGHIACFAPRETAADARLVLDRCAAASPRVTASIRFLSAAPNSELRTPNSDALVLLTNGIGG